MIDHARHIRFGCVAIATTLCFVASTHAQDGLPYQIPAPSDSVSFGAAIASGEDIDGDQCDDIVVMDWNWEDSAGVPLGKWYCYSGVDGALLWSATGIGSSATVHSAALVVGVGGDDSTGVVVALGNYERNDESGPGEVRMYTGLTGDLIWTSPGEPDVFEVGMHVIAVGDVTGDGAADVAVTSVALDMDGKVRVLDGRDGAIVHEIAMHYPERLSAAGDLDRDEVPDLWVSSWGDYSGLVNRVYAISGATGRILGVLTDPNGLDGFGQWLAGGRDFTGDGRPDLVVLRTGRAEDAALLFSGRDGSHIATYFYDFFHLPWTGAANVTGDDTPEILIATWYRVYAFDVWTGEVVKHWPSLGAEDQPNWGSEHALGDLNGDGFMDLLGNARYFDPPAVNAYGGEFLALSFDPDFVGQRPLVKPGDMKELTVANARPNASVHLLTSLSGIDCTFISKLGICIDLSTPVYHVRKYQANPTGWAHLSLTIPETTYRGDVWLQAIELNHGSLGPVKSGVMRLRIVD